MRTLTIALVATALATAGALAPGPASAMGTGDQYEDLQVGVTYTVYEPGYVAGLALDGDIGSPCPAGEDENVHASYGTFGATYLTIDEGRPICVETLGDGKIVSRVRIQGRRAAVEVFCDYSNAAQWRACSPADIARYGGAISLTLPGAAGLRSTAVRLVTDGKKPLTYAQLLRVARNLQPTGG
ncbi:MAG: hypothetical protein Q7V58_07710 [Actinomycetota bacterium]|nr:hypothetical protein [Actinomycetota bacterium]